MLPFGYMKLFTVLAAQQGAGCRPQALDTYMYVHLSCGGLRERRRDERRAGEFTYMYVPTRYRYRLNRMNKSNESNRLCLDIASAHDMSHHLTRSATRAQKNEDDVLQFSSHLFGCSGHNFYAHGQRMKMKSVSIAITAAALAQVAPVDAFVPSSLNHQSTMSSSTTAMRSTVMPLPTAENSRKQQPELDEDDLYMTPPNAMWEPPRAGAVMKMLPKETWDIDTPTSLFYFAVDLLAVVSTMGFLDMVVTSDNYHALPMWAQALAVAPLQVLTGFAMW